MVSNLRSLPSVNEVINDPRVVELVQRYSHDAVVDVVRRELEDARRVVLSGGAPPDPGDLVTSIAAQAESKWRPWPQRVINATGVILHTNLGRAPLSESSIEAIRVAALGYSNLEFDLQYGRRGSRQQRIAELVCQAIGAEAAYVVNNNASAVMLGLAAVATGKEVIVSRGEAVEIGGGFRIPDVLSQSGATLVEVGTTNRTYAADFANAITERTGAILSVHASNFRVVGFTHAPTIAELVHVGRRHGVPVLHDLGSGCLLDTQSYGLAHEPMPQESMDAGVALGFFSGDKLLGGPQAGIITGETGFIDLVARHPLARAVRIDKLSMAALSATMLHYINDEAISHIPVWQMISAPLEDLTARAASWAGILGPFGEVVDARSAIGGGSLPGETLQSVALRVECRRMGSSPGDVLEYLRSWPEPIIARIEDEGVLLDPRTVLRDQDPVIEAALSGIGAEF